MARTKQNLRFLTYNVHGSYSLASLYLILEVFKPGIVFLQEVKISTEQLELFARKLGYTGKANIDETDHSKPGTGLLWHTSLPVTQVISIYPCRVQVAMVGAYPLINVYVPAGSHRAAERRNFFTQTMFGLLAGQEGVLPVCGGDWNCIVEKIDLERDKYFDDRKSVDLKNLIKEFKMVDAFRHLYPKSREYTWQGRDGAVASRLDRFYIPDWMTQHLVDMTHHAGYSDHKFGMMELALDNITRLPSRVRFDSGFWKLNTQILTDRDFLLNFGKLWDELVLDQGDFVDKADWWDIMVKPEIRKFLQNFSATRARTRRQLKELLIDMLDKALLDKDWDKVAMARGRLQEMLNLDNLGFVVRSRFKENEEVERASLYHINREKKNSKVGNVEELFIDGKISKDKKKNEAAVVSYFGNLFAGLHGQNGEPTKKPFTPDFSHLDKFLADMAKLSPESAAKVQREVTMGELELALEKAQNNKSPGLDGIPYEFYKATKDQLGETFVEVLNCQLARLRLMDSNTKGATRLHSKVEADQVPRVDQLRPITLLCCDYKLLTMILSNRLVQILPEIITSGQLCSVKGRSIHNGTNNLIGTMMYVEERVKYAEEFGYSSRVAGGGAIISYDLFKAYDRVFVPYLVKVLAAMGFGDRFLQWVVMLHQNAETSFILNFLTKPVKILISLRQGDPLAMILFLLYVEPLLLMIRRETKGLSVLGLNCLHDHRERHELFTGAGRVCVVQRDERYVDDINIAVQDPQDMVRIDAIFVMFESMSGAILNRTEKTKVMGLGHFEGRIHWPLKWIKVVKSMKIFGVTHFPSYAKTLEFNWQEAVKKFTLCLGAWSMRVLNSVFQRVTVVNTFAYSKLWFLCEALPLPAAWAAQIESHVYTFLKQGKLELPALQTLYSPVNQGGLGLVCVAAKADALYLKQTLRMLLQPGTTHFNFIKYFAGKGFNWGGIVGTHHHFTPPHFQKMVDLYQEGVVMDLCHHCYHGDCVHGADCKDKKMSTTCKELYEAYTDSVPPPRVEYKPEYRNVSSMMWGRVWTRVANPVLSPMSRQVVWRSLNNILPTRDRILRLGLRELDGRQVQSAVCNRCALRLQDSVVHLFSECGLVREAWCWVRRRFLELLPDDMADLSNEEVLMMMYPKERFEDETVWLLGTYMDYVYEEAFIKGRLLTEATVRGYLKYMFYQSRTTKMPQLGYISQITENLVFDDNG